MRFPMTRPTIATRPLAAPLLAALLLAACTGGAASAPSASAVPASSASTAPVASAVSSAAASPVRPDATPSGHVIPPLYASVPPVTGEVPADIMARVRAELAAKIGDAAAASATVEVSAAVTWPDGSLGCPQPGMMYTQMVVEGYQVVLAVGTTKYDYRIGLGGTPSLCESRLPHAASPAAPS